MRPRRAWSVISGWLVATLILAGIASGPVLEGCVDTNTWSDAGPPLEDSKIVDGGNSLDGLKSIAILPADATLYITGSQPVTQTYKVLGTFDDGKVRDITERTELSVEHPRVGIFMAAVFTSAVNWGGSTTVKAKTANDVEGSTSLTVILKRRYTGTGVGTEVEKNFDKAADDAASPIKLVYPPEGTLVPPNLVDLEIQWIPGAGQEIFEVSFTNVGTDIRVFIKCNAIGQNKEGCGYIPDATTWKALVLAVKGDDAAKVMVRGMSTDTTKAAKSNTRDLLIAQEEVKGGLYYWNAALGAGVVRYDFGQSGQKATPFYNAAQAKALFCVGCHAMSLNGKRMAVALDMPAPGPLQVLDVASRKILSKGAANFMAFSPDGSMILTSDGNSLHWRESDTLKPLMTGPLRANGTMADWSPDGTKVVYAAQAQSLPFPVGKPGIEKGSLKLMQYDPTGKKWSNSKTLVQQSGSENNYYPTFSPDNELIIFNRSTADSYDADSATLWALKANGKGKPMKLKNANGAGSGTNCNTWPKFSPFIQTYKGQKLLWVTFTSRRNYGLRTWPKSRGSSGLRGNAQLWMAAIDLAKDEMLTDPSYPAFWLPFQNINTGNHIAQWTKEIVKKPCGIDGTCPPGEVCVKNICEPK
jgi:Tol biopolymer transport system component